jgi:hypothetical protein
MVTPMITFTVHEHGQDKEQAIRIKYDLHRVKNDKTLFLAQSHGKIIPKAYFASTDIGQGSIISIDLIKFDRFDPGNPDLILSNDYQNEIMTAFVGFLLEKYPLKTFSMSGSLFFNQKHLMTLMKTDEFNQRFDKRICYLKGIGDFKLLPKSVSIPTIPGTA